MKIIALEQGSPEWKEWKRLRIGGSEAASIIGVNPWCSSLELWKRKLGVWTEKEDTYAMALGREMEPLALESFEKEMAGLKFHPCVAINDQYDFIIASLDGFNSEQKKAVEIKCGKKSFSQAKKGIIPEYYKCQMQHQMFVCELDMIYYYCFNGKVGITIEHKRDDNFIQNMIECEKRFYKCLIDLVEPRYPKEILAEELSWNGNSF